MTVSRIPRRSRRRRRHLRRRPNRLLLQCVGPEGRCRMQQQQVLRRELRCKVLVLHPSMTTRRETIPAQPSPNLGTRMRNRRPRRDGCFHPCTDHRRPALSPFCCRL